MSESIKAENFGSFRVFDGAHSVMVLPNDGGCHSDDCLRQVVFILRLRDRTKPIRYLRGGRLALSLPRVDASL